MQRSGNVDTANSNGGEDDTAESAILRFMNNMFESHYLSCPSAFSLDDIF